MHESSPEFRGIGESSASLDPRGDARDSYQTVRVDCQISATVFTNYFRPQPVEFVGGRQDEMFAFFIFNRLGGIEECFEGGKLGCFPRRWVCFFIREFPCFSHPLWR